MSFLPFLGWSYHIERNPPKASGIREDSYLVRWPVMQSFLRGNILNIRGGFYISFTSQHGFELLQGVPFGCFAVRGDRGGVDVVIAGVLQQFDG